MKTEDKTLTSYALPATFESWPHRSDLRNSDTRAYTLATGGILMSRYYAEQSRSSDVVRVRVFLDHWEFSCSWIKVWAELTDRKLTRQLEREAQSRAKIVRWDCLANAILARLDDIDYISDSPKELRSIDVYASLSPRNSNDEQELKDWLQNHLDELPAYSVHQSPRKYDTGSTAKCTKCNRALKPELEKGVKTRVACDLLSMAVKDQYDVGVLVMDDPELIPSILCVQEVLDKQIVHIGLQSNGSQVRSAAWGHILLEDVLPDIFPKEEWRQLYLTSRAIAN